MNVLAVGGPNSRYKVQGTQGAGFWIGFWHGLIVPITFIISLFNPGVRIYETNNRGRRYDIGFLLGTSASIGGSGHESAEYTRQAV